MLDKKYNSLVYNVQKYINENYSDPYLTNKNVANYFFTTEKTLIITFKQEFNITPHNYLIHVRMEKAKALLNNYKIALIELYTLVGYSDYHSFRKQFKKYFGIPPSKFKS